MRAIRLVSFVVCLGSAILAFGEEPQNTTGSTTPTVLQTSALGDRGPQVMVELKLVEVSDGKEQVLSWPKLIVASGRAANFVVGNEFGSPGSKEAAGTNNDARFVGTKVDLTPKVHDDGQIELALKVRHSEADPGKRVKVEGQWIPKIHTQEIDTGVMLADGETRTIKGAQSRAAETRLTVTARRLRSDEVGGTTLK